MDLDNSSKSHQGLRHMLRHTVTVALRRGSRAPDADRFHRPGPWALLSPVPSLEGLGTGGWQELDRDTPAWGAKQGPLTLGSEEQSLSRPHLYIGGAAGLGLRQLGSAVYPRQFSGATCPTSWS